ncbi:MAG: precorrin-6y C5,15-methyltransferase (decarboxylating) subunit CbiE [Nitrospiraceae bacterium]|nr:precorrin-6y C5,15-methyltransferase (decarboxylating) subunit CbiE [Nitrospiraceae bacterium]
MAGKIFVIGISGIGFSALGAMAEARLRESEAILASGRLYEVFSGYPCFDGLKGKLKVIDRIEDTVSYIREAADAGVSVLASGDPLFFGIGRVLLEEFPPEMVEIHPAVSSVQLAFARVKKTWEDALFISLHGKKLRKWEARDLPLLLCTHEKIAVLTGGENTPSKIAAFLPENAIVHVLERLGYADEKMTTAAPSDIVNMEFGEPNLMVVEDKNKKTGQAITGLKEEEFLHERGLITKDEVRAIVLHKLRLPVQGVFWDIGAGSGSISIEAKRLSPGLKVYAIEKDLARANDISVNAEKLCAGAVNVITGGAPDMLAGLPAPQRVFIGGSGGMLEELIEAAARVMEGGIIVVAAITIESLSGAAGAFKKQGFKYDICQVSVARAEPVSGRDCMKAQNPVFILRAVI